MIGIAVLGGWHVHARDYAEDARRHPAAELVVIWDPDPVRGAALADSFSVPYSGDLAQVLADPAVDAVVVTSATSEHHELIMAALAAGKHVFTEKVLSASRTEAEAIAAAAERAGVAFMVSMWRSDQRYVDAVDQVLRSGELGRVTHLRIRDGHPMALPSEAYPNGRLPEHFYDPAEAIGGALMDMCHPIYLAARFLGLPERVGAVFGHVTGRDVEDNAVVTFDYGDGTIAVVESGYVSAFTPFQIEAHGTDGSMVFATDGVGEWIARGEAGLGRRERESRTDGWPDGRIWIRTRAMAPAEEGWAVREVSTEPLPTAFEQWIDHVLAGTTAPQNVRLALDLSAVVDAAYRSAASRELTPIR